MTFGTELCIAYSALIKLCFFYLVAFLRAFSRALKILWSIEILFLSPALSRAERAETGCSALRDDEMDGRSMTGGGGVSTAAMCTASIPASAAISG